MKTLDEIRNLIAPVLELYHVKSAYLFGSYARGEATETSDVDLFVVFDNDSISLFEVGGLLETLKEVLQMDVDLLTDGNKLTKRFQENLYRDMIHIYGDIYGEQRYISRCIGFNR